MKRKYRDFWHAGEIKLKYSVPLNLLFFNLMKKYFLFLFLCLVFVGHAQEHHHEGKSLMQREQNAFLRRMNMGNYNPNTVHYDLRYQRLDLEINPANYHVGGSVTSHFIPNREMRNLYLDLSNQLSVSRVSYRGNDLAFQQLASNELKIDFQTPLPAHAMDSITVHYSGAPAMGQDAVRTGSQPDGTPVFSTLSEPYGAQDWFPTKQSLNDKIERVDLFITTPSQYSVAGNGVLMSENLLGNGKKLTKWRSQYPITAYLIALGITTYTKLEDTIGNPPFPFINYVYPSTISDATTMGVINWTKSAMRLFEEHFGEYPFRNEKYGHMQFNYTGVAMEHQTMSSMPHWGHGVTAHELAHQWFGNKITCATWNDIWINEGFAVFGEHLVNEKLLMTPSGFQAYLVRQKNYITSSPIGSVYVPDASLNNVGRIFDGRLSYAKGGYVVRMLKWKLGDALFYQALKNYLNEPHLAYGYAKVSDFQTSFQNYTQVNLTKFMNDWIYGQGYPTYTIRWKQVGNQLAIQANQTQSHASVTFFEMPLPIRVVGVNGEQVDLKLNHTTNGQYFQENIPFEVREVIFNYENQLLERNSTVVKDANLSTKELARKIMEIYPNPVQNQLYIKGLSQQVDYEIYSLDGKKIKIGQAKNDQPIFVGDLPAGKYIITIDGNNLPFVKQ